MPTSSGVDVGRQRDELGGWQGRWVMGSTGDGEPVIPILVQLNSLSQSLTKLLFVPPKHQLLPHKADGCTC